MVSALFFKNPMRLPRFERDTYRQRHSVLYPPRTTDKRPTRSLRDQGREKLICLQQISFCYLDGNNEASMFATPNLVT